MREKAVTNTYDYQTHDHQLLQLIDLLGDLGNQVVWLKGTGFSRTLYEEPSHRSSIDFDFVVGHAYKNQILARLEANGFLPVWNEPGYCHQIGVGRFVRLTRFSKLPMSNWRDVIT